ncbi:hypothetical protein C8R45DRAFT_938658 [Mycena sanguinolenta]|nr:hypothetical protein C8R45DRAFT_938658 [Mycena sanguinolenta]
MLAAAVTLARTVAVTSLYHRRTLPEPVPDVAHTPRSLRFRAEDAVRLLASNTPRASEEAGKSGMNFRRSGSGKREQAVTRKIPSHILPQLGVSTAPARQPGRAQRNETKRNKLESGPGRDADAEYFKISRTVGGVRREQREFEGGQRGQACGDVLLSTSTSRSVGARKGFEDDDEESARRLMTSEAKDRKRTIIEETLNFESIERRGELQQPRSNPDKNPAPTPALLRFQASTQLRSKESTTSAMERLSWRAGWNWELGGPRGNCEARMHMGRDAKREDELDAAREITPPRRKCTSPANPPTSPQCRQSPRRPAIIEHRTRYDEKDDLQVRGESDVTQRREERWRTWPMTPDLHHGVICAALSALGGRGHFGGGEGGNNSGYRA